jgi:hypothetical protein
MRTAMQKITSTTACEERRIQMQLPVSMGEFGYTFLVDTMFTQFALAHNGKQPSLDQLEGS